ncbi:choice-of-anchor L domain-containing protein [Polyangium sp. y55x31]|uniref:choice-of-anchor L domain-containing protein n=1 Tax=Polyangium sp. y55x31 TaxID=3042688 RepID=UPI002482E15E|nr:choice-of-anchor L domain-containing protein [Polyangium sp. y55x31]MDI1480260.1 choice-of-anchor L domain-containing protein [Polyangium sp. y55x31]
MLERMRLFDTAPRRVALAALSVALLAPLVPLACAANGGGTVFDGEGGNGASGGNLGQGGAGQGGTGMGGDDLGFDAGNQGGAGGEGGIINCDPKGTEDDVDGDGFTETEGDCNDCDKNRNPNAVEVPTEPGKEAFDENCNGEIDEVVVSLCDDGLAVDSMEPLDGVRAVDLCKMSSGFADWGVVSAQWTMADGSPPPLGSEVNFHLGHGLLTGFGPNITTRKGSRVLALSSGTARQPTDPGYQSVSGFNKDYIGSHPQGFPKESPACPGTSSGIPYDVAGLEVVVRVPSNAYGFSFDFNFYTYEWPNYICSEYNDFFVALLTPIPPGQNDGNVSFDSQGNPVSVNNSLLEVCGCPENPPGPCFAGGKTFNCSLGNIDLIGTGFGFDGEDGLDHASTGWLKTQAPVKPGDQVTIRFAVYDSGDGSLDTTTLVDNWQWIAKPGTTVGTAPIPK